MGGYKGVLTCDTTLEGDVVCLRPSQQKFDAPDSLQLGWLLSSLGLYSLTVIYCAEICTSSFDVNEPGPAYLNRPLVKTLEDRG